MTYPLPNTKKAVAVFIGGASPEHDVSIVSGLQVYQAIDRSLYEPFIVYITTDGRFFIGEGLAQRDFYVPSAAALSKLSEVTIDVQNTQGASKGALVAKKSGMLGAPKRTAFDIALPVLHGLSGENGNIQGLLEMMGVPYAGMRVMGSAVAMDKVTTKQMLAALGIATLPYAVLKRPSEGYLIPRPEIESSLKDIKFPVIVKPTHLGSSIGVAKANDLDELAAALPMVFQYDTAAIIEPFVQNLVEYNVSVIQGAEGALTSAIERPKGTDELLDFKQKYCSGGTKGGVKSGGVKSAGQISEGMLSLTRELNPEITADQETFICNAASAFFTAAGGAGAPRIDFIGNRETGEVWFNEVNPCPGSYGYFLWEAAPSPILFTKFVTHLLCEAAHHGRQHILPDDPVPKDAQLFKRK